MLLFVYGTLYGVGIFVFGSYCMWRIYSHYELRLLKKNKTRRPLYTPIKPSSSNGKIEYEDDDEDEGDDN